MPCFDSAVCNVKTRQKEEQWQTTRAKHKQKLLQDVGENSDFVFINLFSFISQKIAFVFRTKGTNLGSAHQIQIPQPIPF